MAQNYQRQTGIINIKEFRDNIISIIGCGAIGSFTAISLAKMGLTKFILWDFDKVETHNLPNQFFGEDDIGKKKTTITANYMKNFNNECKILEMSTFTKELYEKSKQIMQSQIIISCVDKMSVRKEIFEAVKKDKNVQLFIDTRMGGLQGQIYCIDIKNMDQITNYEKTLFEDANAVQLRCTERSIIFTVLGLASLVCNQIVKAFKNEEITNFITLDYSVPQMM